MRVVCGMLLMQIGTLSILSTMRAQDRQLVSRVQLWCRDSFGKPVAECNITAFRDSNGKDWRSTFRNGTSGVIPFGDYVVRVRNDAFLPFEGRVSVRSPQTLYLIGLTFSGIDNSPPNDALAGRFSKRPGPGTWCKLSGVYAPQTYFSTVNDDGSFEFPWVNSGLYTLLCGTQSDSMILRAVEVRHGKTPLVIIP